eukprot:GHVP01055299.1.p1 GENE.GHVP01055299.1~~GHVP01055299.1.p1  ORF type:complete len:697 (+),score=92.29 GHVP01055299.1:48-2138(+)
MDLDPNVSHNISAFEEIARGLLLDDLKNKWDDAFLDLGIKIVPKEAFERFIYTCVAFRDWNEKSDEGYVDPMIPFHPNFVFSGIVRKEMYGELLGRHMESAKPLDRMRSKFIETLKLWEFLVTELFELFPPYDESNEWIRPKIHSKSWNIHAKNSRSGEIGAKQEWVSLRDYVIRRIKDVSFCVVRFFDQEKPKDQSHHAISFLEFTNQTKQLMKPYLLPFLEIPVNASLWKIHDALSAYKFSQNQIQNFILRNNPETKICEERDGDFIQIKASISDPYDLEKLSDFTDRQLSFPFRKTVYVREDSYKKVKNYFDSCIIGGLRKRVIERQEFEVDFLESLFVSLKRYENLQSDSRQPGNMQASMPKTFQEAIQEANKEKRIVELFASPFNTSNDLFCSAFPDTDWMFGCLGTGFNQKICSDVVYVCNPPYVEEVMDELAKFISRNRSQFSEHNSKAYITLPMWKDCRAIDLLETLTETIGCRVDLPAFCHAFIPGSRHTKMVIEDEYAPAHCSCVYVISNTINVEDEKKMIVDTCAPSSSGSAPMQVKENNFWPLPYFAGPGRYTSCACVWFRVARNNLPFYINKYDRARDKVDYNLVKLVHLLKSLQIVVKWEPDRRKPPGGCHHHYCPIPFRLKASIEELADISTAKVPDPSSNSRSTTSGGAPIWTILELKDHLDELRRFKPFLNHENLACNC